MKKAGNNTWVYSKPSTEDVVLWAVLDWQNTTMKSIWAEWQKRLVEKRINVRCRKA